MDSQGELREAQAAFKSGGSKGSTIAVGLLCLLLGAAAGAGAMASTATKPKKPVRSEAPACPSAAASAPASASASASAATLPPPPPPGSPLDRARSGDPEAVKRIESKSREQRSLDEAMALAKARESGKLKEIAELKRKITLVPKFAEEKETSVRIKELTQDREVATEMLAMLGSLPGPLGPDLLNKVVAGTTKKTDTTTFAEELLYSKDVRSKASPALAVVLDLRKAEKCEEVPKVLEQAKLVGDRRSLVPIARFAEKRGCGPKKLDDCWKCLREGDLVKDAVAEARKRAGP